MSSTIRTSIVIFDVDFMGSLRLTLWKSCTLAIRGLGRLESWSPWIPGDLGPGPGTWKPKSMDMIQIFFFGTGSFQHSPMLTPIDPKACHRTGHGESSTALQWQSDHADHLGQPLPSSLCRPAFMLVSISKGKIGVSVCWRAALSASR
jgi:hypothetical protein